jgi:hypothetical protein
VFIETPITLTKGITRKDCYGYQYLSTGAFLQGSIFNQPSIIDVARFSVIVLSH